MSSLNELRRAGKLTRTYGQVKECALKLEVIDRDPYGGLDLLPRPRSSPRQPVDLRTWRKVRRHWSRLRELLGGAGQDGRPLRERQLSHSDAYHAAATEWLLLEDTAAPSEDIKDWLGAYGLELVRLTGGRGTRPGRIPVGGVKHLLDQAREALADWSTRAEHYLEADLLIDPVELHLMMTRLLAQRRYEAHKLAAGLGRTPREVAEHAAGAPIPDALDLRQQLLRVAEEARRG